MFGSHIVRVATVGAMLVASHALTGCTALEKLDKGSDELLDKVDPASSPSSSSVASSGDGSGLSVVKRPKMTYRTVKDVNGNSVKIWGQNRSSSTTLGHDATMEAEAHRMARSGDYEYVTIQRAWRTATGRVGASGKIPDVIGVRHDGRVDAVEVRSKTDKDEDLMQRLRKGRRTLPTEHRGEIKVIDPTP